MTKCVFSHMCPSSHVLSPLLGELAQTLTHTQSVHEKHTDAHALADQCTLFLCQSHTHTQMNSLAARRGVWLGQRWTHAGIRAAVCDSHFSLSFFHSLASFSLLSLTPHSHLSLLCLPPCAFANLSVSNVFCTQTHQRTVPEPIGN